MLESGTRWYTWLRCYAASRMIIKNFHRLNPSGRAMALGSTQLLTEMGARVISCGGGVKGCRCLPLSCADCLN